MKEVTTMGLRAALSVTCSRRVGGQEDLTMMQRFAPHVQWEIADGQVDRICVLVSNNRELSFVRRHNDRDDGSLRVSLLEL